MTLFKRPLTLCAIAALLAGSSAQAQDTDYSLYGAPGLIEMPNARSAADAEIAASITYFTQQQRNSFTFQLTPRLSGTFRYAGLNGVAKRNGPGIRDTFDRSFDLRYRITDEGDYLPAIAIGLQDFLGTGFLSSEYIVASKQITPDIDVTGGIGWGRFGSQNGFTNPLGLLDAGFETRPELDFGRGGKISGNQFFRGDAALFGGVAWKYSDKLTLTAEYSSDAYTDESRLGTIDIKSPVNVGLTYRPRDGVELDLAYLYGSEIAAAVTLDLNPRDRALTSGLEPAPLPVRARGTSAAAAESWTATTPAPQALQAALADGGIRLLGLTTTGSTARVRYANETYRSEAQGLGRVARAMTQVLPDAVTTFILEPTQAGIALSSTTLQRADLERLENTANAADALRATAVTTDITGPAPTTVPDDRPAFTWGLSPYASLIVFNGNAPVQLDYGLGLRARYEVSPNLVIDGGIRQSALGKRELAEITEVENGYPNVRTSAGDYGIDGNPVITDLTVAHYGRPAANLYSRVSLGYLETMYGGVSTELLWKPVDSRLALGAELNYVMQRDTDMLFGFQDFDTVTGHLSAYYHFDNGFHGQVDVGRYLAGDWGATVALDREFDNGWKVGAYFTLTDMPFEDFGEGSFDKGIRITVPTDFFLGTASRRKVSTSLASLTRDGGARVDVDGRLYDIVRDGHTAGSLGDTWGRFWR